MYRNRFISYCIFFVLGWFLLIEFVLFRSSSSSEIEKLELLGGDSKISERVLSSTFRLSPTAFFQVNTLATELLYSLGESIKSFLVLENLKVLNVATFQYVTGQAPVPTRL